MTEKFPGLTTAINLLDSARMMRYPIDIRRNVTLARSALYDVIVVLDSMEPPRLGSSHRLISDCKKATVAIRCPVNGTEIETDVEIDVDSFETAIFEDNQIKCSSCGQWHQWATKDTFLL